MKLFEYKNNVWLFGAVLLAVFAVSTGVRYQQFETWKLTPQSYFVGERPMMTTLDAPYWLRIAREYNEGVYRQKGGLRGYPEGTDVFFNNDVDSLYCYTRIQNQSKKQEVKHVWYYEDQLMTLIRYNIKKSNIYRSWTRKTILPHQVGHWRVDIQDSAGKIIGSKEFQITS